MKGVPGQSSGDTDYVAQFLQDINVMLDLDYADPKRVPFEILMPQFSTHADLDLAERISASYEAVRRTEIAPVVRGIVTGSLLRCASNELGLDRGLVVADVAHAVCPEVFTDDVWGNLLFRQSNRDLPRWLRDIALRLRRWNVALCMPAQMWRRAVRTVHPTGFELLVRWGCDQQATDKAQPEFRQWLLDNALQRLRDDARAFRDAELDVAETRDDVDELRSECLKSDLAGDSLAFDEGDPDAFERAELMAWHHPNDFDAELLAATRCRHSLSWEDQLEVST